PWLEPLDSSSRPRNPIPWGGSSRSSKTVGHDGRSPNDRRDLREEVHGMSTEAQELHRIISASVRDMLDAYRIQASAGPVTDQALDQILFRAAHGVLQSFAPYPAAQRLALLPNAVHVLLATFLEDVTRKSIDHREG